MLKITTKKEFIDHFQFRVVRCSYDKKPYERWEDATINPNIETDCYACFAGGAPYKDGVIVVIDLDNHTGNDNENGKSFWDRWLLDRDTLTVSTPSGGEHLYFLATKEQIENLKEISPTGTRLADQVEIFWNGKHLNNGPFSKTIYGVYSLEKCMDLAPLPYKVVDLFQKYNERKIPLNKNQNRTLEISDLEAKLIVKELEGLAEEGEFEDYGTWTELMLAMRNAGFSVVDAQDVSWKDEKTEKKITQIWNESSKVENSIGLGSIIMRWVPDFADKKWRADKLEEMIIEETLKKFGFLKKIKLGATTGILDLSGANKMIVRDYKNTLACYQSKTHQVSYPQYYGQKKEIRWKDRNGFDVWWKEAEALEGLKTFPYKPMGEIEEGGYRYFNDWEEAEVKEGEGSPSIFYQHLLENICDADENTYNYLRFWIWDLIANPDHKNNIAVAITGKPGTGKSTVFKVLQMCFHPKYSATIDNTDQLMNRFDADWKNCILVAIEEACFAGDRKSGVWGKMKSLITDDEATIERKNHDRYKTNSMLHFIITGNNAHIVPKEKGDRRYLVLECNDKRLQDVDYFSKLFKEMENGGARKLIEDAHRHKDACRAFPFHKMPITTIGVQNVRESADFVLQWLMEQIETHTADDEGVFINLRGGDIALRTRDVAMRMREEGIMSKFDSITIGKKLRSYFGMEPRAIKIDGKNLNGYRFESIEEVKEKISHNYFGGENPFISIAKEEQKIEEETEIGALIGGLGETHPVYG